jgi:hypothetical protein
MSSGDSPHPQPLSQARRAGRGAKQRRRNDDLDSYTPFSHTQRVGEGGWEDEGLSRQSVSTRMIVWSTQLSRYPAGAATSW